jgi:uncharacterized protein (TIGR02246 family)
MRALRTLLVLFAATASLPLAAADLPSREAKEIRRVVQEYVDRWKTGDGSSVMELLTDDAVLLPHHGLAPVVGATAIRAWWWPSGATPTVLHHFEMQVDDVGGDAAIAFARGRQSLEWSTGEKRSRNAGTFLMLFRKSGGRWRITHQMWSDPPNERVEAVALESPPR